MAIFIYQINNLSRGAATTYSDYISRSGQFSDRTDLVATGHGNLPSWANGDPRIFWSSADQYERKNGASCREIMAVLPRELNRQQWVQLVEKLIAQQVEIKPYQYAIHVPREDDAENAHPHVHLLWCDRLPDGIERAPETFFKRWNGRSPELGGCKKDSGGRSLTRLRLDLLARKGKWVELTNAALSAAGHSARIAYQPANNRRRSP